jgi:hypothetical protein
MITDVMPKLELMIIIKSAKKEEQQQLAASIRKQPRILGK